MKYLRWVFPPSVQRALRRWARPALKPSHWTARRATLSRHWCKNTKTKRCKERGEERKDGGEPVEERLLNMGLPGCANHNPFFPAPQSTVRRHWSTAGVRLLELRQKGNTSIRFRWMLGTVLAVRKSKKLHLEETVQDFSLDRRLW